MKKNVLYIPIDANYLRELDTEKLITTSESILDSIKRLDI